MSQCNDCPRVEYYKTCQGLPKYTYGDIRWCEPQVIWIITHFFQITNKGIEIGDIRWEVDPSNYTDISITRPKSEASFCQAMNVVGELDARLKQCPDKLAKLLISELTSYNTAELCFDAKSVLRYLTGWRRKRKTFTQWLASKTYREKG